MHFLLTADEIHSYHGSISPVPLKMVAEPLLCLGRVSFSTEVMILLIKRLFLYEISSSFVLYVMQSFCTFKLLAFY